jgi:hypothetical protein
VSGALPTPLSEAGPPDQEDDTEIVSCVLGILAALLGLGSSKRPEKEEAALRGLLQPLQTIAFKDSDELAQAASEASLMLLNRFTGGAVNKPSRGPSTHSRFAEVVASALSECCSSPEVPLRAMGVHTIMTAIKEPEVVRRHQILSRIGAIALHPFLNPPLTFSTLSHSVLSIFHPLPFQSMSTAAHNQ